MPAHSTPMGQPWRKSLNPLKRGANAPMATRRWLASQLRERLDTGVQFRRTRGCLPRRCAQSRRRSPTAPTAVPTCLRFVATGDRTLREFWR